jgi:23S rRNA (guanosine2251-2'-O)-methyltransferase
MKSIIVIAHDIRSAHNVGSLLRTAEGLGVDEVILSGFTPYPSLPSNDPRLPHHRHKIDSLLQKTALNAQNTQSWRQEDDVFTVIDELHAKGYTVAALEQSEHSVALPDFKCPDKLVLLLGREVEGIEDHILRLCDTTLEIPMFGAKESFNVVQAAAMALYHCRFIA